MKSADKNLTVHPITETILDEENEESGVIEQDQQEFVEEEIDDDIERSPEVVDLQAVKEHSDVAKKADGAAESTSGSMLKLQKIQTHKDRELPDNQSELTTPKSRQLNINDFDVSSKNGFKQLLRFQMRLFDQNYDFETDELVGGEAQY